MCCIALLCQQASTKGSNFSWKSGLKESDEIIPDDLVHRELHLGYNPFNKVIFFRSMLASQHPVYDVHLVITDLFQKLEKHSESADLRLS